MSNSRSVAERKADVLAALEGQGDLWLATAGEAGRPHLIAVSAWWDGTDLVVATTSASRTAVNLAAGSSRVRLAAGAPADAIMIDANLVDRIDVAKAPEVAQGFAGAVGWNPAEVGPGWEFFRLRPTRIQAYRGYEELEGRNVMSDSRWLD